MNTHVDSDDNKSNSNNNSNNMSATTAVLNTASSNQSGSNDFVKKLFQMLQEVTYKDIVTWTTEGDSFVVLNTNEFTKEILPRHFKHSNFASFVRQLNKYDFHKVKIPNEEKQNYKYGEDAWEFKHPDFRINDRESLENIKRKGPTTKKAQMGANAQYGALGVLGPNGSVGMAPNGQQEFVINRLNDEMNLLKQENKSLFHEINIIQTKYKAVVNNIIALKAFDERYYQSMGVLVNCLVQAGIKIPPLDFPNPALANLLQPSQAVPIQHQQPQQSQQTQLQPPQLSQIPSGFNPMVQAQQSQLAGSASSSGVPTQAKPFLLEDPLAATPTYSPGKVLDDPKLQQPSQTQQQSAVNQQLSNSAVPSASVLVAAAVAATSNSQLSTTNIANPKFHVLLVEDDNVCIQLCRKFLVKYGCQVTVATDGLNAILTVEHTRYDLVLMDIVMPNLDGATATSVIRSFDTKTPIIAMTGNIEEYDLVTYLENGMSDILAKPFTKDDLYNMLSKHLLTPSTTPGSGSTPMNTLTSQTLQPVIQGGMPGALPVSIAPTPLGDGEQDSKRQRLG